MSYGIIRVQKFKASDVRGIQSHDRREREPHSNPDIDKKRSGQNYALVESPNFRASIQDRLEILKSSKGVRKDAVVMCQFLVTSDHGFFQNLTPEKQKAFFQNALQFIGDRYGRENVLSATVHMDEKTPHMHVNLTPIRDGRLTAKEIFNRSELTELQTAFHSSVGQAWGLERGQSREDKRRHLDTEAFKTKTQKEELERQTKEILPKLEQALERYKKMEGGPQIRPEDVYPKKLQEGGLLKKEVREDAHQLAARLNKEFVNPLFVAVNARERQLADLQSKQPALEIAAERYKELTNRLLPQDVEKLKNLADDIRRQQDLAYTLEKARKRGFKR